MIVSAKPLDDLRYKGWTGGDKTFSSLYASSVYLGWAMAAAIALVVMGVLPIVSWFATYRFSLSSALCIGIFTGTFICYSLFITFSAIFLVFLLILLSSFFYSWMNIYIYIFVSVTWYLKAL